MNASGYSERVESGALTLEQLCSAVESLLFVAGRPLAKAELRRILGVTATCLDEALAALSAACQSRGVRVQQTAEEAQMVTAPENARFIAALLGWPASVRLTAAALETLAVVAYRQPVTRGQIESIRGVNSDRALASLVAHGLVEEVGRAPTAGRPALFATTLAFLEQFGLPDLGALPDLPALVSLAETASEEVNGAAEGRRARVAGDGKAS
jgi:segregation and condensation protein B